MLCVLCSRWRVEAEVKMELERLRANGGAEAAAAGGGAAGARMAEELSAARGRGETREADVGKWEAALAARDVELQNLQRALGEPGSLSWAADLVVACSCLPLPAGCGHPRRALPPCHSSPLPRLHCPSGATFFCQLQAS